MVASDHLSCNVAVKIVCFLSKSQTTVQFCLLLFDVCLVLVVHVTVLFVCVHVCSASFSEHCFKLLSGVECDSVSLDVWHGCLVISVLSRFLIVILFCFFICSVCLW